MNRRLQQIWDGIRGKLWMPPAHIDRYGKLSEVARKVSLAMHNAERQGEPFDHPEGARYIQLSDTLATKLAAEIYRNLDRPAEEAPADE